MSALTPSSRLSVLRTVFQRQRSVGTHMKIMRPLRLYSTTSTLQGSSQEIPMTPSYSAKLTDTDIDVSETRSLITREQLHKLHTLSALNPPPENSAEEQDLIEELSGLIGLMNQVQDVPLPSSLEERAELLSRGMGQVVVSQESLDQKSGKELLIWSTNRLGDYYTSRIKRTTA
ncbi:uncharacterized protein I303_105517 [Kwoniella dejecticola CBS 10117]|uniref:Uncharacterized protein n=1 Tax=Kwoniella dejecticola CBS 10117 TaxID=1296121 RepID=A0AAJ8KQM8_9TREE